MSRLCNYKGAAVVARSFSSSSASCATHYDSLGLTPKATQSEIKTAYYKLSMQHHPDKSDDAESAKKFRAITEAYEVLGNVQQKHIYDRGLLSPTSTVVRREYHPDPEPTDPTLKFYKSRSNRHMAPVAGGARVYDFDTWTRNHYSDMLKKTQATADSLKLKRKKQEIKAHSMTQEALMYALVGALCLGALLALGGGDYDRDTLPAPAPPAPAPAPLDTKL